MEWSFRTFSQWQDILNLFEPFCFTDTNINNSLSKHIDLILVDWKDIHKNTLHGLALCYNMSRVTHHRSN